jgi:PAS domain S-box-containing protein
MGRFGLRTKLFLAFGLVLLPVLVLLIMGFRASVARQEALILEDQRLTAEAVAIQVDGAFDASIGLGWAVANDPLTQTLDPQRLDIHLRQLIERYPFYEEISVFDAHGINRGYGHLSLSPEPRFSIADKVYFQSVMATDAPAISQVIQLERPAGAVGVVAAVPVRDAGGQVVGVVTVVLTTDQLAKRYEETRLLPGQAIVLADRNARLAFHSLHRSLSYAQSSSFADLSPVRAALAGIPSTVNDFADRITSDVRLGAFVPTLRHRWAVGVTMPPSVALAPVYEPLRQQLAVFALILLLSGVIASIMARYIVRPFLRLNEAALALGRGELARRVKIRTGDEIERLGESFNEMAGRVAERTEDLARARRYLDDIIDSVADPIFVKNLEHRWVLVNRAFCDFVGRGRQELLGKTDYDFFPKSQADVFWLKDELVVTTGRENINEEEMTDADGVLHTIVTKKILYTDERGEKQIVGVIRDVTERKRLEEQLRQAQKMESVGLLAGGIAHDFNNLLTPILGNSELLLMLESLPAAPSRLVREVKQAAERASELTRQLLAFGRKQMLSLRTISLGDLISRFEPMLRRTIREDIRMEISVAPALGLVRADVGQLEQVILNLAINAQDSMLRGGTLTIEMQNVELDRTYVIEHSEVRAGPYVMIAVSDTGSGMDSETQQRLFEPFFTTKERGKGTGLGLSMAYGIVKQHGGSISVYSEPGKGSTFTIYLPRIPETTDSDRISHPHPPADVRARRGETILVVEDNDMVRTTACEMLLGLGYRVLAADSAEGCYRVAASHEGKIDLLLTDVILSESNGKEVFSKLRLKLEDLKVVYMSGYTGNVIVHHGVVDEGIHFIQKPLSLPVLSSKIREVLDEQ